MQRQTGLLKHLIAIIAIATSLAANNLQAAADAGNITRSHGIAMHGEPKYPATFTHFEYTSDKAVTGGMLALGSQGSFDSLSPFIFKGDLASGVAGLVFDTLLEHGDDEPFTMYGLVAQEIEWPEDRSWVRYYLNPKARFHDGREITADDVAFSFKALTEKGSPLYQAYYAGVDAVKVEGKKQVLFTFKPGKVNRELPLILGQLPILPKHHWESRFGTASLEIPLGSGPYRVVKVDPGRRVVLERNKDYWAKDLPVRRYMYNFDQVRIDYYRDASVLLEALKAGEFDYRFENISKQWYTGYNGPALKKGLLVQREIPHENPSGMQCLVMNLRKPIFQDIRVRKALNLAFDFEWTNKQLFHGAYVRNSSYFSNSELASSGVPSGHELEILEPFRKQLPETLFTKPFSLPVTDGSGNNREQLREAKKLLEAAGWKVANNKLVNAKGEPFKFEILVYDGSLERIVNPYVKNLQRLGIEASVRRVEMAQYINRLREFDYDMELEYFTQSSSPGNEQMEYWHSSTADVKNSQNYIGIKDPIIDKLTELVVAAPDREELTARVHALDRVLLHNYFVIPGWHVRVHRVAYWNKFSFPETAPKYDFQYQKGVYTWWIDNSKQKATDVGKSTIKQ